MYSSYYKQIKLVREIVVRYLLQCSYLARMILKISNFIFDREYWENGALGAFKYFAYIFTFL